MQIPLRSLYMVDHLATRYREKYWVHASAFFDTAEYSFRGLQAFV